jgi:hypothetical protein
MSALARDDVPMYIERVPNRSSRPAVLLRESFRCGSRVKKRTLANLSSWPADKVEALRTVLRGDGSAGPAGGGLGPEAFEIERSLPHGHVAAVLGTLRRLGLPGMLSRRPSRQRDLAVAMVAARVLAPRSKLATARGMHSETLEHSLGEVLGLADADEDELYAAMDFALTRQQAVEKELARRHLGDGCLVLYDVTSTYFEGRRCPLAKLGYNRDGKKGKLQVVVGLLCDDEGRPVAVEVFPGNTGDPTTVAPQLRKLREDFGLERLVLVGDRGMLTQARINKDLRGCDGVDWVTALRAPSVRRLVERGEVQLSLFDERDLVEVESPHFPGERLVVCRNPLLAEERARKRKDLLAATETALRAVEAATTREHRPLRGAASIGKRVGSALRRYKMAKHFEVEVADSGFTWARREQKIAAEAALDGLYVLRTSVPAETMPTDDVVSTYKRLSQVERAFRSLKTVDLKVRPVHHRLEKRVRAHVFLCMLAYYVEWHMREALAPLLFDDEDPAAAEAQRTSPVAPAERSEGARRKASERRTPDDHPVQSFQGLLRDLATVTRNHVRPRIDGVPAFVKLTTPTPTQRRALELLEVRL